MVKPLSDDATEDDIQKRENKVKAAEPKAVFWKIDYAMFCDFCEFISFQNKKCSYEIFI